MLLPGFRAQMRSCFYEVIMRAILTFSDLTYLLNAAILRDIRRTHVNAVAAVLMEMAQIAALLGGFMLLTHVMSFGGTPIRGDMLIYLMTGIFVFQVHTRTMMAVFRAETRGSQIMNHKPLSSAITVAAAALGSLYLQVISAAAILAGYHFGWSAIELEDPVGLASAFFLAWALGVAMGLACLSLKSVFPSSAGLMAQLYSRANMLASGQMFVANALPSAWLVWFSWNPLFHIIDQARGFAFQNYEPWFTSFAYPAIATGILLLSSIIFSRNQDF